VDRESSCHGTKALAAEPLALNQAGEGSSPSGPTRRTALVVQWPGHRTRNAATWVRVPPGALCFLDKSASEIGAHDVAAAYRLAKAEVRVRLPLGTSYGMWESLVQSACFGSRRSPVQIRPSRFLVAVRARDQNTGVAERKGGALLRRRLEVRLLPPVLEFNA
jgi:hypothetical protein